MHLFRSTPVCALIAISACAPFALWAQNNPAAPPLKLPASRTAPQVPLSTRERAQQILNRFTFGPRPGEVEAVAALGPDKWFAQQLAPETITDKALDGRLRVYPTLTLAPDQVLKVFPDRQNIQQAADGKTPYPADPLDAAVYEVQIHKLLAERAATKYYADQRAPTDSLKEAAQKDAAKKADQAVAARIAGELFALPRAQRMNTLIAMPVEDRIVFVNNVGGPQRDTLVNDLTPQEREAFYAMQNGVGSSYRVLDELAQAHMLRAVLTERQLQEVMTDFWFNHFNVFMPKDSDQWYTTSYERDAIRPHALGKFRDLLLATAQSPAMMVYLDNWLSIGPDSMANGVNPANPKLKQGTRGLNENYGREVMELHTLGVNAGYTHADVTHLSAILTGWGVDRPNQGGPFQYDPKKHEPGTKEWFGYTIDEQGTVLSKAANKPNVPIVDIKGDVPEGMRQGITALAILAGAPQTAHFISFLIAQRFLADAPPPALVDRMTATYLQSDGDIKAVLRTLVGSPEFNSHRFFRNKVKTPTEFLASAFRVTATDPQNPGAMVQRLRDLGQAPYAKLEPTGYYITADHWMNTASLVKRLNFADELTHSRFANQKFDASRVLAFGLMSDRGAGSMASASEGQPRTLAVSTASAGPGPDVALQVLEGTLIGGELSPNTDRFIHGQLAAQPVGNPGETLNLITALLLGSPEFQLR